MMQNAQMHQMMMQQLMMSAMPKSIQNQNQEKSGRLTVDIDDIISVSVTTLPGY